MKSEPAKEIVDVIESSDASAPFESSDLDIHSEGKQVCIRTHYCEQWDLES